VTYPGRPFTLTTGIAVLLAGISTSAALAADRYWDPLNNNSYLSTGYTTYTAAAVVWNTTNAAFDVSAVNATNAAWAIGDDAFINMTPAATVLAAPASTWYMRIGTTAPTVHNVTYDSTTSGALLVFLANSTAGTSANIALTPGTNGASTWNVGASDTLRLSSGGDLAGSTNVGPVNLANASGVTTVDFVKEGAGRMHIQNTGSSFTGKVRINAGALQINGNGSLGNVLNDVYIADGATLSTNTNATIQAARTIFLASASGSGTALFETQGTFNFTVDALLANNGAGIGSLNKTNTGTLTLTNLNTYTGVTTVTGGTLRMANLADGGTVSAIGASSSAASNLVLNSGTTLNFIGTSASSTNRLFTIAGSTNISNNSSLNSTTLAWTNTDLVANTAVGAHTLTLGGTNQGANVFAPALTDNGANVLSLVKGGAGNWTLTGVHNYTGTTTVGNGTAGGSLEFNGALTGAGGNVDVTTGNRLSGAGLIQRNVAVTGTLAPGSIGSPLGSLTINGAVTFNTGGGLAVNLAGTASSKVTGVTDLALDNNTVTVTLNPSNLPAGTSYDIFEFGGAITGTFNPVVAVAGLTGLTSRIAFGLDYSAANKVRLTQTGQAKNLAWTGNDLVSPATWNVNGVANWNAGGNETFFDLDTVTFGDSAAGRVVDITTNVTPSAIVMNNTSAADYVISASTGAIIGPAPFTKTGSGTLTIAGAHSFTGPFSFNAGIVSTSIVNDAAVAGPLGRGTLVFGGGKLEYTGTGGTTTRPIEFAAGGGTVDIPTAVDLTFSAAISGAGGLTKTGAGILRLPGANGFDGPVLVSAGVLKLGNNNSLGTAVSGTTVSAGATLDFAATSSTMALPQDEVLTVSGAGVDLDADAIPDGALVNFGTTQAQNAVRKVVLAGDTTFGGTQRFDIRIAGTSDAGFIAGTDAYLKGNGFSMTKVGTNTLGIAGVGETDLANIEIKGGSIIFHDAGNSDVGMMLASDTTLGRVSDGAGTFYKVIIQPGATLQFYNSDGIRSKDIITNGVGGDATISMNSNVSVAHTLQLNRGITASGGLTLTSSANETTLLVSGVISDGTSPAVLTKNGSGVVALSSANPFTGGMTVTAGKLQIGHDGALGSGGLALAGALSSIGSAPRQIANPLTVTGNSTLGDLIDNGALTFSSQVNLGNAARNLTINSNVTFATGMTATSPGGLGQKLGTGTLTVGPGASSSSGTIEIRGGSMVLASGAALASGDAVRVMANTAGGTATFSMLPGSSITISVSTANLRVGHESATISDGTNIANIAGTFTFPAGSTQGSIQLGSDSAFAQVNLLTGGSIAVRSIGLGAQTPATAVTEFNFDGGILRAFLDNPGFFPSVLTSANVKAGGGTIDSNGFGIAITQPLLHDPALGASPDGGITKIGAGTLTLNSVNTYTGATIIDGGTLSILGPGSISGSATIVNPAGTLTGTGSIGDLKLSGGTVAPGIGIGSLIVEDDVEFAGGIAAFEINGLNAGIDYDQLVLSGFAGSVTSISAPTELSLTIGFTPSPGDSFTLVENVSANPVEGPSLFTAGGIPVANGGAFSVNGMTFTLHYDGGDGNDISITAVPEPGSAVLLLGGLGIASNLRRRRG
jgi:fibronectin-binding autotransporter adhesin